MTGVTGGGICWSPFLILLKLPEKTLALQANPFEASGKLELCKGPKGDTSGASRR